MKTKYLIMAGLVLLGAGNLNAGEPAVSAKAPVEEARLWDPSRPDSHAPVGVMGDHTHEAGGWMLSYQWMHSKMDGQRAGTNSLSNQQVYDLGYHMAVTEMQMDMHMFGIMYAPTDALSLMAMLNYVEMDMQMITDPHAEQMMAMSGHGGIMPSGHSGHSSSGLGDITLSALYKVYDANYQRVHFELGLGLPSAEVDKKQGGEFLPYDMQLGSGTWDLKPGVTYLGQHGLLSWGAQASAVFRLESANESGFAYGDGVNVTPWLAYRLSDSVSISGRLNYDYAEDIRGHYNGPHGHMSPPNFQANYGGHMLEAGLGLNYFVRNGFFKGHRLAVEGLLPVYQDRNGVGMDQEFSVVIGWQKGF